MFKDGKNVWSLFRNKPAVKRLGELEASIDELFDLCVDLRNRLRHGQLLRKVLLLTHTHIQPVVKDSYPVVISREFHVIMSMNT